MSYRRYSWMSVMSVGLVACLSMPALAKGGSKKGSKKKPKVVDTEAEASVEDAKVEDAKVEESDLDSADPSLSNTSKAIRKTQAANVELLYTPLSDYVLSYGVGGSYNLKPNLALGLQVLMGSKTVNYSSTDQASTVSGNAKIQGTVGYVYGRYFFGNSFNMMTGLGVRSASIKYILEESSLKLAVDGKIDIQSIALPVFIGNRWTFKSGFTIGCDWIGAFVPLSGSAKSSLSGNLPNEMISDLNDKYLSLGKDLTHKTSMTLFLTSLGWAF